MSYIQEDDWIWIWSMNIVNRCELANWRNKHVETIFLEIIIESNGYQDFRSRLNGDKFSCEDSYIHFLYFFTRYFDDKNIKYERICRKNDLTKFFIYYDFINLQNVSFNQKINNNLFNDLKFNWKIQNSGFRSVFGDNDSIRKVHWQDYIILHVHCDVFDVVEFEIT